MVTQFQMDGSRKWCGHFRDSEAWYPLNTNVMEICNDLSSKIKSSFIMTLFKQFADKNDVVIC